MTKARRLAACAVLMLLCAAARAGDAATCQWKGAKVSTDALPTGFPVAAVPAVEHWAPWAREHGYKLELESSGRALIVLDANSAGSRWVKAAEGALRLLDEHLPAPQRSAAPAEIKPKPKVGGAGIPEDPEGKANPAPPPAAGAGPVATQWGAGTKSLDTETFALFIVRDEEDYAPLLDELVKVAPYLAPWRATATSLLGFALEEPLAGAVVLGARQQKEWDPENEAVHRAAELALLRRFGRQPYWLLQGWAWHTELSVRRHIYCFPYRSGFVAVGEHTGWDKQLKLDWQVGLPTMADLGALRRGVWDDRAARAAWGTVAFLDRYYRDGFVGVLEELRAGWDKGSRKELGGGRWERDAGYQVPFEQQLKIIAGRTSANFLVDVKGYFTIGSSYRPGG